MSFKNDGIQVAEYEYDFEVDGGATGVYSLSGKANKGLLPNECVILRVVTRVVTAFEGSGASAKVGSSASDDAYLAVTDVSGLGADVVNVDTTNAVVDAVNERDVLLTVSGAALTAGKLKVLVEYLHHS